MFAYLICKKRIRKTLADTQKHLTTCRMAECRTLSGGGGRLGEVGGGKNLRTYTYTYPPQKIFSNFDVFFS